MKIFKVERKFRHVFLIFLAFPLWEEKKEDFERILKKKIKLPKLESRKITIKAPKTLKTDCGIPVFLYWAEVV